MEFIGVNCLFERIKKINQQQPRFYFYGSRTIAPEENCPPSLTQPLTQTLTLPGGQFSSRAIIRTPIFTNSSTEFLLKFFPVSNVKSKHVFLKLGVTNVSGNEIARICF